MNKLIKIISVSMLAVMLLTSCTGETENPEDTTTTTTTGEEETPTVTYLDNYDENAEISLSYNGTTETANGSVELEVTSALKTGKKIEITIPETQHFIAVTIAKGVLEESIVYVENGKFEYKIGSFARAYPSMTGGVTITARIPTLEELKGTHNLALNTCDLVDAKKVFPHASTTNVHNNDAEWAARNIIDGFTQNNGHGEYPYQSWGPGSAVSRTDNVTIDFGHDVCVQQLVIYIRADFPHDGYWDECRVTFSDGTYQDIQLEKTAKGQKITINGDVTTSSLKFSRFTKAADSTGDWCAWMEVQVMGHEI